MTTRRDLLRRIAAPLEPLYGPREARQIALTILSARTNIPPGALLADPGALLELPEAEALADELATGRPLQYVLGFCDFCGLRIGVREGVLIPRPETEELVTWIAAENPAARRVLDIGTGSGCIALALKHLLPAATICGADLSTEALTIARANAAALGLETDFRRADALQTDVADAPPSEAQPQPGCNTDRQAGPGVDPHAQTTGQHGAAFRDTLACESTKRRNATPGHTLFPDTAACTPRTSFASDSEQRKGSVSTPTCAPDIPDGPNTPSLCTVPDACNTTQEPTASAPSMPLHLLAPPAQNGSAGCAPTVFPDAPVPERNAPGAPPLSWVFPGPFDVVVSNPPYIPTSERAAMRRNVTDYEPGQALFVPDDDPLCFYRAIACTARRVLAPDGALYFEIHEDYSDAVCLLLSDAGFTDVELQHDFRGKPRMVRARKTIRS